MGGRIFGSGALVTLAGLVASCSGGPGPVPAYGDNYDSLAGARESPGVGRETPPIGNERAPFNNERAPIGQYETPPGTKLGGGIDAVTDNTSFKCSGAYVCKGADGDTDNVTLNQVNGKCVVSGGLPITLESDGSATITANGKTQVLGNWSVSGDTLTFTSGQTKSTCTPRVSSRSGSDQGGG